MEGKNQLAQQLILALLINQHIREVLAPKKQSQCRWSPQRLKPKRHRECIIRISWRRSRYCPLKSSKKRTSFLTFADKRS